MKTHIHLSRRGFLKATIFGAAALTLDPLKLHAAEQDHTAATQKPANEFSQLVAAIQQPAFNPIASSSVTGTITDVAMGWDGAVWGLDGLNGPQRYDPLQDAWLPFGKGIDAMTTLNYSSTNPSTHIGYVFMGEEYVTVTGIFDAVVSNPTPIATTWPNLPDTFKLGVDGAASINGQLVLIKGGLYVPAAGGAVKKLSDMANWPQTANWADGLIDAVYYKPAGTVDVFYLIRNGECIAANFQSASITQGPQPVSTILPASLNSTSIDAAALWADGIAFFFQGSTFVATSQNASIQFAGPLYIGAGVGMYDSFNTLDQKAFTLPTQWFPALNHAPSGRAGGLWAAATNNTILQHDGERWNLMPGAGSSVAVGQDNSVFVVGTDANLYRWNGTGYDALGGPGAPLAQVSAGDAQHVWVRDTSNNVHRYQNNAFNLQSLGAGVPAPTHIAANADGTIWHCNSSNPNAYRLITEATSPSDTINVMGGGVVAGVSKVATTGYGTAYCATSGPSGAQLYRYNAPYVFKSANAYSLFNRDGIVTGLGRVFMVAQTNLNTPNAPIQSSLVALDAHTGAEIVRTPALPSGWQYSDVTFDPLLELIYVGTAPADNSDAQSQSQLLALDARTLNTVWSFTQTSGGSIVRGIDSAPGLQGTLLAFGDRSGNLIVLDTQQALSQSQQGQPIVELTEWSVSFTLFTSPGYIRMPTPVFMTDHVYGAIYNIPFNQNPSAATMQSSVYTHNTRSFLFDETAGLPDVTGNQEDLLTVMRRPAVIVTGYHPALPETPMLAVNHYSSIAVVDPTNSVPTQTFVLPSGYISTGLTVDDGMRAGQQLSTTPDLSALRLWFCDSLGNLWALGLGANNQWTPQNSTPRQIQTSIYQSATPVLHKDPAGGATVLLGMLSIGANTNMLYGFDPDTGNLATLPTGQTSILALSKPTKSGVVYAGGIDLSNLNNVPNASASVPQIFGIRIDTLLQGLRDFIADSQMMQDPDPNAPGGDLTDPSNPIPPSRARYQTHITLVDNDPLNPGATTALPFEPVKIWADQPTTIAVNGNTYDIGPGDADCAHVATGGDGTLVITSGYLASNDAPDLYATTLRLWAGFMNPYERVVVHPDYEFHVRVSQAHANAGDDNPDKPNLITAKSYAATKNTPTPAPLFNAGEVSAGQPQNCANAIAQMRSGVGFGTSTNSAQALLRRHAAQTSGAKSAPVSTQTTQRYVAYTDTLGMGYHPDNAATTRPVAVVQPTGMTFIKPQGQPTSAAALTTTSWSSAQSSIDALPAPAANPPWASAGALSAVTPMVARNIFTDFWNWLKNAIETAVVEITHVIVSVANDVMVGIRLLVNGVEHVFKAVVKVLDDIASVIGALFNMLLKLVEDVIAVLGWFFEFGEFIKTHNALKTELLGRINQFNTSLVSGIKSAVDSFFTEGETAIAGFFDTIRSQFGNQAVEQQQKMGSTPHTALTVNASAGGTSNQSVQGMWATQKLKSGMAGNAGTSSLAAVQTLGDTDPFTTFLDGFVASLTGNGTLAAVFNQFKSDATKLLSPKSAKQFLATLMSTLLDIIEAVLVGALALGQALVDGLLDALPSVLDALFGPQGLLTAQLNIPVLSWLYDKLFGEPLTFTNVVFLVTAIPVTLIYRIGYGMWPSSDPSQMNATGAQAPAFNFKALARVIGFFGGIAAFAVGIANFFVDIDADGDKSFAQLGATISTLLAAASFPIADIKNLNRYEIAGFGIGICVAIFGIVGVISFKNTDTQKFMDKFVPILLCFMNIALLGVIITGQVKFPGSEAAFIAGLLSTFPGIVNPLKLTKVEALVMIVGAVDVLAGIVICALNLVLTFSAGELAPRRQLYLPWIARPGLTANTPSN